MVTVKQLSALAGVSIRTLHYYDEIGLLSPTRVGANGYRYYDDAALMRLQQILFFREIGLELLRIKEILDQPGFDVLQALQSHRSILRERIERLEKLVETVDSTIMDFAGEVKMSKKRLFEAFSAEKQKDYERSIRLQYGPETVNESTRRWGSYNSVERERIADEGNQVYSDLADAIQAGKSPQSLEVQTILGRWHRHLTYFYEPTLEILRGLGQLYNTHPDFIANFRKVHPSLPEFMQEAIGLYVDDLETAEIRRMLEEKDNGADSTASD
jgi:DNA-binding transcriptional MerR regulator